MTAKAEIDWKQLDTLLQFKVPAHFVADQLGIAKETLYRHIKEVKGMTFGEYHELRLLRTGTKLQQKAIEMALHGDRTMLIFCLKNIAGWADKHEVNMGELEKKDVEDLKVEAAKLAGLKIEN